MTEEADLYRRDPPLYEARSVPFEKLSADDFEKCVFSCFLSIQSHQGLRVDGKPAGSGDGGFDVYGVAVDTHRGLCIQCKRQKTSLGLPLLAKEVAKVALTACLGRSDVGVHFFICTGGVTQELRRLLRETDRLGITNAAETAVSGATEGELNALRERVVQEGLDPEEVVRSYVQALDRLIAWDMDEFDAALSPAWDSAFKVLERYFRVSTAIREHPRPLFHRQVYQENSGSFSAVVQPQLKETKLPTGLVELSGADPGPEKPPIRKSLLTVKSLAGLSPGETALVVAEGGAGKTTLLELVRAEVAQESFNSALAVLITCAEYVPGALDTAVHMQLGVQSGSWRMLPDRIQILCDGLNEAPSEAVRALFSELKPLLQEKRISCIFTSREDSRMVRTVLPSAPIATLRLLPLSPGRVRTIAYHTIAEETEVAAFSDAHRSMAARTTGSFMWTPFAVRAALNIWEESKQLGNTLGDLLDAIVSARAERDLEIPAQDSSLELPRSSILAIAGAMAFQMVVVDGHTACSVHQAGAVYRRAMRLCVDVYGIDGLNSSNFIGLLRRHDLVQKTVDESFRWNHQLVAGALAARYLADHWRQNLKTLQQTIPDDAWVFATRYISELELDEYLGELFDADLMLGARATAELPLSERDRSLKYILHAITPGQPEELQVAGFFALARVGTTQAISFLQEAAEGEGSELGFVAARALAYSGDRPFLLKLLAEVDRCRQMGWVMSGGDISVWETASPADRMAVARERLTMLEPGEPVNESINLIGHEASQEDLPLLENHFHAAKDVVAWSTILRAIVNVDRDRAQRLLEGSLAEAANGAIKADIMTAGHKLGLVIDVEAAFSLLMELSSEKAQNDNNLASKHHLIKTVLGELPLTATICRKVEDQLPTSTGEKKSSLWQIATLVVSPKIALYALDAFENDLKSVGMAANFFLAQKELREEHHEDLQVAIGEYLQDRANWYTFNSWRTLVLEAELGFTALTTRLLQQMILRLAELLEAAEDGKVPTFSESESHLAQGFKIDSARTHLQHFIGYLVPGAVAAREFLSDSVLLRFLHFDLANYTPGKEIVGAYREIAPDLLDEELESVRDAWAQRAGLEMVCEFGLTCRRLELLRTHLKESYCLPAPLNSVKKALEKCWDTSACIMVVETIAGFETWPKECEQFFSPFIDMVSERLTCADRDFVEYHLASANTAFARRVLRIWRQATIDSRVGLSRSEAES